MNWARARSNWKQVKGEVRKQWGKLTDDDLDVIQGEREQLVGRIEERYAYAHEQAERDVKEWERTH